jgi:Methyltransferase domain
MRRHDTNKPAVPASAVAPQPTDTHWPRIAGQWRHIGTPLRPCDQDIAFYTAALSRWSSAQGAPRGLILGVTPELWHLRWPEGSVISAVDRSPAMIDTVWPGPRGSVVCADWTDMPLDTAAHDLVFCDGGLVQLSFPRDHWQLVRSLQRVLVPEGLCVLRLFVLPQHRETPHRVLGDLLERRIPNLNILKLRLGMALRDDSERGVTLASIWDALHDAAPDFNDLAVRLGWPLEHLLVIDAYRGCLTRYHFLSLAEICRLFTEDPGGFKLESIDVPSYDLGERCPTVVFRRRATTAVLRLPGRCAA